MTRTRRRGAILAAALLAIACRPSSSIPLEGAIASEPELPAPRLSGMLQPGGYRVGFRKETLRLTKSGTAARSAEDPTQAPPTPTALDVYLWFPTMEPQGSAAAVATMELADYYRVQEAGEPDRESLREWLREDMTSPPELETAELDAVLEAPMWASSGGDAGAPSEGRHPLVLWSYRNGIPTMQAVLNEYLASHGYVVAFGWPVDHAPPLPWEGDLSATDKKRALKVQVELLGALLDSMIDRPWIDDDRIAVLSWSYGGESANALQRRRPEVRLAVGVDTTLASGWIFQTAEDLEKLDRSELSVPYVLLQHGRPRIDGDPTSQPALLAEVPAGAWHLRFPELSHGNFNFPGGMIPGVLGLGEVSRWAVGGETARVGYEMVCRHVLGSLDHHLRGRDEEPARWSASAPDGFVEIERHPVH